MTSQMKKSRWVNKWLMRKKIISHIEEHYNKPYASPQLNLGDDEWYQHKEPREIRSSFPDPDCNLRISGGIYWLGCRWRTCPERDQEMVCLCENRLVMEFREWENELALFFGFVSFWITSIHVFIFSSTHLYIFIYLFVNQPIYLSRMCCCSSSFIKIFFPFFFFLYRKPFSFLGGVNIGIE